MQALRQKTEAQLKESFSKVYAMQRGTTKKLFMEEEEKVNKFLSQPTTDPKA